MSHWEKCSHIRNAPDAYTMSVTSAPMKQTTGAGKRNE
jgi:hypothetical protein